MSLNRDEKQLQIALGAEIISRLEKKIDEWDADVVKHIERTKQFLFDTQNRAMIHQNEQIELLRDEIKKLRDEITTLQTGFPQEVINIVGEVKTELRASTLIGLIKNSKIIRRKNGFH